MFIHANWDVKIKKKKIQIYFCQKHTTSNTSLVLRSARRWGELIQEQVSPRDRGITQNLPLRFYHKIKSNLLKDFLVLLWNALTSGLRCKLLGTTCIGFVLVTWEPNSAPSLPDLGSHGRDGLGWVSAAHVLAAWRAPRWDLWRQNPWPEHSEEPAIRNTACSFPIAMWILLLLSDTVLVAGFN